MVDLLERLEVLLRVEDVSYRTIDYLSPSHQQNLQQLQQQIESSSFDCQSTFTAAASSSCSSSQSGINEVWREKICEWSYQVIDHFDFSREVVSVSIHYLDRFLATTPVNKKLFQLVAMTALYLAIKIHEPTNLTMRSMIELSRGYFTAAQMADMEMAILRSLSWKLHPPTSYCFCKHILFLLPQSAVPMETRYEILELARFLTELSVIDYYFVIHRSSDVALAALLNSMEAVTGSTNLSLTGFEQELARIAGGLDPLKKEVLECRDRLLVLYTQGGYSRPDIAGRETRDDTVSPVCVSFGLAQQEYPRPAAPVNAPEVQDNISGNDCNQQNNESKVLSINGLHDLTGNASPISNQQQQFEQAYESIVEDIMFGFEDDE
ncbi:cyclin-like protein [Nitzschia inconspicua]|uniref:Cyclin-like protein n=1 Tax=Nitzschia inconspicua TaxID=303405 RepID=A0A9K3LH48_9STRA|nr:cyclin-like protein [Nitzschia inconspicua]